MKDCSECYYCKIPVMTDIVYLGVTVTKNKHRSYLNFNPGIQKTESVAIE